MKPLCASTPMKEAPRGQFDPQQELEASLHGASPDIRA